MCPKVVKRERLVRKGVKGENQEVTPANFENPVSPAPVLLLPVHRGEHGPIWVHITELRKKTACLNCLEKGQWSRECKKPKRHLNGPTFDPHSAPELGEVSYI